jgi:hypothetical protein
VDFAAPTVQRCFNGCLGFAFFFELSGQAEAFSRPFCPLSPWSSPLLGKLNFSLDNGCASTLAQTELQRCLSSRPHCYIRKVRSGAMYDYSRTQRHLLLRVPFLTLVPAKTGSSPFHAVLRWRISFVIFLIQRVVPSRGDTAQLWYTRVQKNVS